MVALALERGWIDEAQLERARALGRQRKRAGRPLPSLLHALLETGALRREQIAALRAAARPEPRTEAAASALPEIPGYEILGVLGTGGMGTVYKARQRSLDRIVALKVLAPEAALDPAYLRRFLTEARALARLNHENIIAGIDVGEAGGYRYFAMEYVDGLSLDQLIERDGPLEEKRALRIAMQVARALAHAHGQGLVHRDVKPQNIMVADGDRVKLCDLGLAMTERERAEARGRGKAVGTPHYVSPEQARGEQAIDIRSDIYSLGATLYHALTGAPPFEGSSAMVLMTKHLTEPPEPPHRRRRGISRHVSALVLAMMAKAREQRHQHPIELLEDMERVLHGKPPVRSGLPPTARRGGGRSAASARRSGPRVRSGRRRAARTPHLLLGLLLGTAALIGAAVLVVTSRTPAPDRAPGALDPEAQAQRQREQEAAQAWLEIRRFHAQSPGETGELRRRLAALIERFPGTEAARLAEQQLAELGAQPQPLAPDEEPAEEGEDGER
ncbi:MAG: serine/threonine protein kinase [Planctomycetota bacterium]|nr:MAG: serine/threonine protein kinase [Planctomycetota bacterium]